MEDNEIQIGKSKIGFKTIIKFNVKTLLWILGILWAGLFSLATIGYYSVQDSIDEKSNAIDEQNKKMLLIEKDISLIKGDIKVILDRTSNKRNEYKTNNLPQ